MSSEHELFIVDNSEPEHSGLHYLTEWAEFATSFDIASGYFDIGALLELDGHWQKLDKIRILMGDEVTHSTKRALLEAVKTRAEQKLNMSVEEDKEQNPFLNGVDAIVEAIRTNKIECRVFSKEKFHAKTYITHAKSDVVGSMALVGSSNFTRPGLTQNIELNIQARSGGDVQELQKWFEKHWSEAEEISDDILKIIERHTQKFTPFDIYTRALHELFHGHDMTAEEWEQKESQMFAKLDRYQKEAYWKLIQISKQHGGAMLCDGVGLGKTFVGLMLIERMILQENKRVLLLAPKGAREGVWDPHLKDYLPHIGGSSEHASYSNLLTINHTDLSRKGEYLENLAANAKLADVVIIDEAHHFRNQGTRGDLSNPEERSRYWTLYDMLNDPDRPKQLFMLTATPINNSLHDFKHQIELFSLDADNHFSSTIGVPSLAGRIKSLTQTLNERIGVDSDLNDHLKETRYVLDDDELFKNLVVQRSRSYAKKSQITETGNSASFPERKDPKVEKYSITKTYGGLLAKLEEAFNKDTPLFSLPIYYPLNYYKGNPEDIEDYDFVAGRQKQVVQLVRTVFLKRFESSVFAFETSCNKLLRKLLAFLEKHCETESEKKNLLKWRKKHEKILNFEHDKQLEIWGEEERDEEDDALIDEELLESIEQLNRDEYDVSSMILETFNDLDVAVAFLEETQKISSKEDDKLKKLTRMLKTKDFENQKVLIFSEFADTVRYIEKHLKTEGIDGVEFLDSASGKNRKKIIKRFSPYYNTSSTDQLPLSEDKEIRILVATDVLSEGLNLQDACRLINYDIHWNPVRLMQRIGRVDRRLNPEIEEKIKAAHPDRAKERGVIKFWNFLPPKELKPLLSLYEKVSSKTLLISETLGIEGKKLLRPEDNYQALKDLNAEYEGEATVLEKLALDYHKLLKENPELENRLTSFPKSIFSGRKKPADKTSGVFFCYRLPAWDTEAEEFTLEAGPSKWYLYDIDTKEILEEPREIIDHIRCTAKTPRVVKTEQETLIEIRGKVKKHIKDSYLKLIGWSQNSPKESLICWMEINES